MDEHKKHCTCGNSPGCKKYNGEGFIYYIGNRQVNKREFRESLNSDIEEKEEQKDEEE